MMREALSRDLGASLHHQVYAVLRSGIVSGRYPPGAFLPAEEALATEFSVSRVTIRRAMQSLEAEGLIERRQGRGTQVRQGALQASALTHGVRRSSRPPAPSQVEVREFEVTRAGQAFAEILRIAPDAEVFHIVRLRTRGDLPVRLVTNILPRALVPRFRAEDLRELPIADALLLYGVECQRAEDEFGATLADHAIASALKVRVGAPLIEATRVLFEKDHRPVVSQVTLIPPERDKIRLVIEAESVSELPWGEALGTLSPNARAS